MNFCIFYYLKELEKMRIKNYENKIILKRNWLNILNDKYLYGKI